MPEIESAKIARALGLPDDATTDDALEAIARLNRERSEAESRMRIARDAVRDLRATGTSPLLAAIDRGVLA